MLLGWPACTWEPRLSQLKEVSSVAGLACLYRMLSGSSWINKRILLSGGNIQYVGPLL
jgi:hypothetical protein